MPRPSDACWIFGRLRNLAAIVKETYFSNANTSTLRLISMPCTARKKYDPLSTLEWNRLLHAVKPCCFDSSIPASHRRDTHINLHYTPGKPLSNEVIPHHSASLPLLQHRDAHINIQCIPRVACCSRGNHPAPSRDPYSYTAGSLRQSLVHSSETFCTRGNAISTSHH